MGTPEVMITLEANVSSGYCLHCTVAGKIMRI